MIVRSVSHVKNFDQSKSKRFKSRIYSLYTDRISFPSFLQRRTASVLECTADL